MEEKILQIYSQFSLPQGRVLDIPFYSTAIWLEASVYLVLSLLKFQAVFLKFPHLEKPYLQLIYLNGGQDY